MATNTTYGHFVFGLSDLKITNLAGTVQADLSAAMEMTFTPMFRAGELFGDDSLKAVISYILGGELSFTAGSMSSAALAIVTGKTLSTSGSTPNEVTEFQLDAGDVMPYFKVYAKSRDDLTGDVHALFHKVKLISGLEITMQDGEWVTPGFECRAVDNGTNGVFEIKQNETAANLPTS
jgi:hypothetical protein